MIIYHYKSRYYTILYYIIYPENISILQLGPRPKLKLVLWPKAKLIELIESFLNSGLNPSKRDQMSQKILL